VAPTRAVATPLVLGPLSLSQGLERSLGSKGLQAVASRAYAMCMPLMADVGAQLLQKGEQVQGSGGEAPGCGAVLAGFRGEEEHGRAGQYYSMLGI
jgi:hypothetical protein